MILLSYCDATIYQLYIKDGCSHLEIACQFKEFGIIGPSEFCETKRDLFQIRQ